MPYFQMFGARERNGGCWNLLFSRPFNDGELEEVDSFLSSLSQKQMQEGLEDKMSWLKEKMDYSL